MLKAAIRSVAVIETPMRLGAVDMGTDLARKFNADLQLASTPVSLV